MNNNRSAKLHALMHCITTTLGERSSARQRIAEMGTPACWCAQCRKTFAPQCPPSFEPSDYFQRREENVQYHNSHPQAVEWANNIVYDLRKKYPRFGGDDVLISFSTLLQQYPSEHTDTRILHYALHQNGFKIWPNGHDNVEMVLLTESVF